MAEQLWAWKGFTVTSLRNCFCHFCRTQELRRWMHGEVGVLCVWCSSWLMRKMWSVFLLHSLEIRANGGCCCLSAASDCDNFTDCPGHHMETGMQKSISVWVMSPAGFWSALKSGPGLMLDFAFNVLCRSQGMKLDGESSSLSALMATSTFMWIQCNCLMTPDGSFLEMG